jgi:hypothetical protein
VKKVVEEIPKQKIELVTIEEALTRFDDNKIIVYMTKGDLGIAILQNTVYGWGFRYHGDLIHNRMENVKYVAETKYLAVEKVLHAQREVFTFSHYKEYLSYAAAYDKS